jgi:hypothetical protein
MGDKLIHFSDLSAQVQVDVTKLSFDSRIVQWVYFCCRLMRNLHRWMEAEAACLSFNMYFTTVACQVSDPSATRTVVAAQ